MSDLSQITQEQTEFFLDIVREIEKTPYGEINFAIQTHRGRVSTVVSNEFRSKRFNEGENHIATAELLSMIKNMVDRKESGSLSFTVTFKNGTIKELVNQFYNKKLYAGQQGSK